MIQIRMMKQDDMEPMYGDPVLKALLVAQIQGEPFCIVAEENGKLIGGLSGAVVEAEATLQVCAVGETSLVEKGLLTEGLIRSALYVMGRRGVDRAYLLMEVDEAVRQKIGFAPAGDALPGWVKYDGENAWSIDIKEFLAQDGCGCRKNASQ